MDDLISRQALLDDIEELKKSPWFNDDNYFAIRKDALSCVVDLCIKKTPSEQQWIPCSERLPDSQEDVLCDEDGHVILGFYTDEEIGWHDTHSYRIYPTAWMPLPEPYKGETDG